MIPQSISNCSWYETSPENIKLLLFMIMRTQQPMTLTVGKFTELSIKGFTKVRFYLKIIVYVVFQKTNFVP